MKRMLVLLLAVAGCSQSLGTLSAITIAGGPTAAPVGPRIRGKSCASSLMGLPLGAPSLEAAARAAQRKSGAAELRDVRVSKTFWSIGLYSSECLVVEAAQ